LKLEPSNQLTKLNFPSVFKNIEKLGRRRGRVGWQLWKNFMPPGRSNIRDAWGRLASRRRRSESSSRALARVSWRSWDALYVPSDPLVNTNRIRLNTLALGARLPTMHGVRDYVEAGVLWTKHRGPVSARRRLCRQHFALRKVPGDIPVEQPTKFDLVINISTAKRSV
jgi:hypothetical protein